jgi:signal transduction histidine kinase
MVIRQSTLNRLVIGAVVTGFLALVLVAVLGVVAVLRNLDFSYWVTHTYRVQNAIADYRVLGQRLETARRGVLLSADPAFLQAYHGAADEMPRALDRVDALVQDNRVQLARVAQLRQAQRELTAAGDRSLADPAGARAALASHGVDPTLAALRRIQSLSQAMLQDEQQKLDVRDRARRDSTHFLIPVAVTAGLLLIFVAIGSTWAILLYTRDLTASRSALAAMNLGLEDEVKARTTELSRANEEIQRFAYIVSHDLRSPLVNVMGFTSELEAAVKPLHELLTRAEAEAPDIASPAARLAITSDLPESIGFIRASTQKMDRLINAILRLSREGRRVLTPEAVNLNVLFGGIADSLRHRADELGASIEVEPHLPTLISDRLALEQIFSNLVENALKYLKPGRPGHIQLRASRRGGRVVVEVADNGRGVDPRDHERIFDLFRRSGVQDQPGEGIGLAHVRALGHRLGATIIVDSALDQGATFRVSLPEVLALDAPE